MLSTPGGEANDSLLQFNESQIAAEILKQQLEAKSAREQQSPVEANTNAISCVISSSIVILGVAILAYTAMKEALRKVTPGK
jgi:hypothetical protein